MGVASFDGFDDPRLRFLFAQNFLTNDGRRVVTSISSEIDVLEFVRLAVQVRDCPLHR